MVASTRSIPVVFVALLVASTAFADPSQTSTAASTLPKPVSHCAQISGKKEAMKSACPRFGTIERSHCALSDVSDTRECVERRNACEAAGFDLTDPRTDCDAELGLTACLRFGDLDAKKTAVCKTYHDGRQCQTRGPRYRQDWVCESTPESEAAKPQCIALTNEVEEAATACSVEREQIELENEDPKAICKEASKLEREATNYYREHVRRTSDRASRICGELQGPDCSVARNLYSQAFNRYHQFYGAKAKAAVEKCDAVKKARAAKANREKQARAAAARAAKANPSAK